MVEKPIDSNLFIGREEELTQFQDILTPKTSNPILNIHGQAGIGKTQLLLKMREEYRLRSNIICGEVIDCYDVACRSKDGILKQIVHNLGLREFSKESLSTFGHERTFVLFFDSYEYIQNIEKPFKGDRIATTTWLETELFPQLTSNKNIRIIVAGCQPMESSSLPIKRHQLTSFITPDTINSFCEKYIGVDLAKLSEELKENKIDCPNIHEFFLKYKQSPIQLLYLTERINREWKTDDKNFLEVFKCSAPGEFSSKLIEPLTSLATHEERAIGYMAVFYHCMTSSMFYELLKNLPSQKRKKFSKKQCQKIFNELKKSHLIKYKEEEKENIFLLHQDIRRLLNDYWWANVDRGKEHRKEILLPLFTYYIDNLLDSNQISEVDREIYRAVLVEYLLSIDPKKGVEFLCDEFDLALEKEIYDFCVILASASNNYKEAALKDKTLRKDEQVRLFVRLAEIDYRWLKYEYKTALQYDNLLRKVQNKLDEFQKYPAQQESLIYATIYKLKSNIESKLNMVDESKISSDKAQVIIQKCPIRMLHLSDLHFKSLEPNKERESYRIAEDELDKLTEDLKKELKIENLDYLIISGDLTNRAETGEFNVTREFIVNLMERFDIATKNCILVPGNHDQSWKRLWQEGQEIYRWRPKRDISISEDEYEQARYFPTCGREWPGCKMETWPKCGKNCPICRGYLVQKPETYPERFQNFTEFFHTITWRKYPYQLEKQTLSYYSPVTKIQFITFNSSWQIDELFPKRCGVEPEAFRAGLTNADAELKKWQQNDSSENNQVIRIAILHHPVTGDERIANSAEFIARLRQNQIRLILHGHLHEDKAELIGIHQRDLYAIGVGTFAAPLEDRPPSKLCLYNILEISRDYRTVTVRTRSKHPDDKIWQPYAIHPGEDPDHPTSSYQIPLQ